MPERTALRCSRWRSRSRQRFCARWDGAGEARVLHTRVELHSGRRGAEQACRQQRRKGCRCAQGLRHDVAALHRRRMRQTVHTRRDSCHPAPNPSQAATTRHPGKIRSRQRGTPHGGCKARAVPPRNGFGSCVCAVRSKNTAAVTLLRMQASWS